MIPRYSRPEMDAIWSDAGRYARWLEVELTVSEVLAERGEIPAEAARILREKASFDAERVGEIEAEVRHDVIAFLTNVAEHAGPEARWLHYGMTSSDVLDTALALQIRDAGAALRADLEALERALRDAVRRDRARTKILRTSPFGLIEMTRQRIRPSLKRSVYKDCPCCQGRAVVKTPESMAIEVVRTLMMAAQNNDVTHIDVEVNNEVAAYLNNKKRREITRLEEEANVTVQILGSEGHYPEHLALACRDEAGRDVTVSV